MYETKSTDQVNGMYVCIYEEKSRRYRLEGRHEEDNKAQYVPDWDIARVHRKFDWARPLIDYKGPNSRPKRPHHNTQRSSYTTHFFLPSYRPFLFHCSLPPPPYSVLRFFSTNIYVLVHTSTHNHSLGGMILFLLVSIHTYYTTT